MRDDCCGENDEESRCLLISSNRRSRSSKWRDLLGTTSPTEETGNGNRRQGTTEAAEWWGGSEQVRLQQLVVLGWLCTWWYLGQQEQRQSKSVLSHCGGANRDLGRWQHDGCSGRYCNAATAGPASSPAAPSEEASCCKEAVGSSLSAVLGRLCNEQRRTGLNLANEVSMGRPEGKDQTTA